MSKRKYLSKEVVVIDTTPRPAFKRNGHPAMTVGPGGARTQMKEYQGVDAQVWRDMVYAERRAREGRYAGVFGFPAKKAA